MTHRLVMPCDGTPSKLRSKQIKQFASRFKRLAISFFILASVAQAQNRVVVIPMPGEDIPVTPSVPIANADTGTSDYAIADDTVTDNITQLQWQRGFSASTMNWDDAWNYCANLFLGRQLDWRLPTIKELASIVDYGRATEPLIDLIAFASTPSELFWSSSGRASTVSDAWGVNFSSGLVLSSGKTGNGRVRCVR